MSTMSFLGKEHLFNEDWLLSSMHGCHYDKPWTPVSPELLCPPPVPTCVTGKLSVPLRGPPHSPLVSFIAQQCAFLL